MKMSTPAGGGDGSMDKMDKSIVFNASKNEKFKVNDNYRIFQRKTKAAYSNVMVNKDMITPELLRAASLFICTGPREQFTITELNSLKTYLDEGGSLLIAQSPHLARKDSLFPGITLLNAGTQSDVLVEI
ncbi:intraflagellar transport protein 52 homolog [Diaphorina citri]|uniref:Intraflagellar transport protein 52 homolog n=1 Tax=Diaphorina citri TaxID=121845 RepID=A0A3Q0IUA4_DIACI|nr:intraflagellar transport protein 52 homolog [Diaphorina citri]